MEYFLLAFSLIKRKQFQWDIYQNYMSNLFLPDPVELYAGNINEKEKIKKYLIKKITDRVT